MGYVDTKNNSVGGLVKTFEHFIDDTFLNTLIYVIFMQISLVRGRSNERNPDNIFHYYYISLQVSTLSLYYSFDFVL